MALTPAQKIRQEKLQALAAKEAKASGANPHGGPVGSDYQLLLARLAEHKRKLADIKSNENKATYKVEAIADFDGWIEGVLKNGTGEQDEIFATMLAWNVDAGNYPRALELAQYAIKHNLALPDNFNRSVAAFLMDEFFRAAVSGKMENAQTLLAQLMELTVNVDVHDQPRSKLYMAHAFSLIGRLGVTSSAYKVEDTNVKPEDALVALNELKRAKELDNQAGCVKDIEKLERYLKNVAPDLLNKEVLPAPPAAQAEGNDKVQTPEELSNGVPADSQPPVEA